jgi:hypothetical protein
MATTTMVRMIVTISSSLKISRSSYGCTGSRSCKAWSLA